MTKPKEKKIKHDRHTMEYNGHDMGCAECSKMYISNRGFTYITKQGYFKLGKDKLYHNFAFKILPMFKKLNHD